MRFTNRVRIAAILLATKDLARQSRKRNSEHLAQRRQGRKGRRKMVKIVCKIIYLSLPNLACFASRRRDSGHAWRESIPVFEYFRSPDSLREPRKLSTIVIRRTRRVRMIKISTFVLFVSFVVKNSFTLVAASPHHRHAGAGRHPGSISMRRHGIPGCPHPRSFPQACECGWTNTRMVMDGKVDSQSASSKACSAKPSATEVNS